MVEGAATLIKTQGVTATSLSEVLVESGAPRGSIYHHFPQGKRQLVGDAVRWTSERVLSHQGSCPSRSPEEVLGWFVAMWRQVVVASSGAAGCVVAGVAVDSPGSSELIDVVRDTFRSWVDLVTAQLESAGLTAERASSVATTALAAMEGALILCRAERDVRPLDVVAEQLGRLLD